MDVTFILRGRPGLGHVIPGYNIAKELKFRGFDVSVITYGQGKSFLESSDTVASGFIDIDRHYIDWPGLDIYNHGVRCIAPILLEQKPKLCILGGEYLMPPLIKSMNIKSGIIFNPEIMEKNDRNAIPSSLFCQLFTDCDYLIPLIPIEDKVYLKAFKPLQAKLTMHGPFCSKLPKSRTQNQGRLILIANGGGVDFPERTDSYSSSTPAPENWLNETITMTRAAIDAAVAYFNSEDEIQVFSCLSDEINKTLIEKYKDNGKIQIHPPSPLYYDFLSRADIIISRAGCGLIADVRACNATAILWILSDHEEQFQNVHSLIKVRDKTILASNITELIDRIKTVLTDTEPLRLPTEGEHLYRNVQILADVLEECLLSKSK